MTLAHITPGVLATTQLQDCLSKGYVTTGNFGAPELDGSAINLRLGSKARRLKVAQRPTTRELEKLRGQSEPIETQSDAHGAFFEFKPKQIYLVELDQHLKLPSNLSGRASGKSSVGRLDVITRLLSHNVNEYDLVAAGYDGPLFVLLMPQTFTIRVAPGASVNQLRLFSGSHSTAVITRDRLPDYGTPFGYVLQDDSDDEVEAWDYSAHGAPTADPLLLDLTVDLADTHFPYVFKARSGVSMPVDLRTEGVHNPSDFFMKEAVEVQQPDRSVILEPNSFYIMKSRERLFIPDDVAVEVVAISERLGDIRIHYAGFAHPGFGRAPRPQKRKGTPLIFEVRATDMSTKLYDRSLLARIQLFRMSQHSKPPSNDNSAYEMQELKLSKVFAEWPEGS